MAVYTVLGFVLFGVLLFWPAGTFDYWQAWAVLAIMLLLSIPYTLYLAIRRPDVLQRRLRSGPVAESRGTQKLAVGLLQVFFLAMMVVSAFDHRFGWSHVPFWLCVVGIALTALGYGLAILVVVQNSWAAATIAVEAGQELVSTGLYGVVRHPMYTGALIMLAGMPLGLGSYWGLLPGLIAAVALILRILDEEKMLVQDLAGYPDYRRRVPYRLVPYLW